MINDDIENTIFLKRWQHQYYGYSATVTADIREALTWCADAMGDIKWVKSRDTTHKISRWTWQNEGGSRSTFYFKENDIYALFVLRFG